METATFANRTFAALIYFVKKAIFSTMFTVSECDLISNTLTSHDSAPIRGRPTLKDAERFRTGYYPRIKKYLRVRKNLHKQLPKIHKKLPKILYKK